MKTISGVSYTYTPFDLLVNPLKWANSWEEGRLEIRPPGGGTIASAAGDITRAD